jgi:hypothetical protein
MPAYLVQILYIYVYLKRFYIKSFRESTTTNTEFARTNWIIRAKVVPKSPCHGSQKSGYYSSADGVKGIADGRGLAAFYIFFLKDPKLKK